MATSPPQTPQECGMHLWFAALLAALHSLEAALHRRGGAFSELQPHEQKKWVFWGLRFVACELVVLAVFGKAAAAMVLRGGGALPDDERANVWWAFYLTVTVYFCELAYRPAHPSLLPTVAHHVGTVLWGLMLAFSDSPVFMTHSVYLMLFAVGVGPHGANLVEFLHQFGDASAATVGLMRGATRAVEALRLVQWGGWLCLAWFSVVVPLACGQVTATRLGIVGGAATFCFVELKHIPRLRRLSAQADARLAASLAVAAC